MSSAHTPGPWRVGASAVVDNATDYCIVVDGKDEPKILAEAYGRADWEHPFPSDANARLIAAAPELYEALRKISDMAKSHPTAGVTCGEIARTALAKVTP